MWTSPTWIAIDIVRPVPTGLRTRATGSAGHYATSIGDLSKGSFKLWFGPATKPSSDMEILNRSFGTCSVRPITPPYLRD